MSKLFHVKHFLIYDKYHKKTTLGAPIGSRCSPLPPRGGGS